MLWMFVAHIKSLRAVVRFGLVWFGLNIEIYTAYFMVSSKFHFIRSLSILKRRTQFVFKLVCLYFYFTCILCYCRSCCHRQWLLLPLLRSPWLCVFVALCQCYYFHFYWCSFHFIAYSCVIHIGWLLLMYRNHHPSWAYVVTLIGNLIDLEGSKNIVLA